MEGGLKRLEHSGAYIYTFGVYRDKKRPNWKAAGGFLRGGGGGGVEKKIPGWRLEDWQMEGLYIGLSVQKQVRQERG